MIEELAASFDFSWALRPSGIYFLMLAGRVQYVGKSTNIPARISQHRNNLIRHNRGLPTKLHDTGAIVNFDSVRVLLAPKERLDSLEIHWIQRLNPPCNTQLNRPIKVDLKKHAFFHDLLTQGKVRAQREKETFRLRPVSSLYGRPKAQPRPRFTVLRGRLTPGTIHG